MTDIKLSRRTVLQAAGGTAAFGGAMVPGLALAATEIDAMRALIGTRYAVSGGSVVLEDILESASRPRVPGELSARQPFIAVFRQTGGAALEDGTHAFSADGLTAEPLLVSRAWSDDGENRLEAVFN